jgi:hypothetical protein
MVGFSLAHGSGAGLFLFPILLFVWTATVIVLMVWNMIRKRQISKTGWVAFGLIVLLFRLGAELGTYFA